MKSRIKKINSLKTLKKVGFIIPAANTTIEPMLNLVLNQISDRISIHVARFTPSTNGSAADVASIMDAATSLSEAAVDMVIWFTPASDESALGTDDIRGVCRTIEGDLKVPVSASALAVLDVLKQFGLDQICLLTASQADPNPGDRYSAAGHDVLQRTGLDTEGASASGMSFEQLLQRILDGDSASSDCIVIDDIDAPSTLLLDDLEHTLGKPVFDVVTAVVWQVLRTLDINNPLHGWGQLLRNDEVVEQLNTILHDLMHSTSASRTTIRLDVPHLNIGVDDVYAEATELGVSSLRLDSSLNQRSLATVLWMEKQKRMLIQDDCINTDVPPPKALIGVYGVKAQMLGPLLIEDALQGWISVHYIPGTRTWNDNEITALKLAMDKATEVLKRAGWF